MRTRKVGTHARQNTDRKGHSLYDFEHLEAYRHVYPRTQHKSTVRCTGDDEKPEGLLGVCLWPRFAVAGRRYTYVGTCRKDDKVRVFVRRAY